MDPETVPVQGAVIRLGQLLKLVGVADSGADARSLLSEGEVTVNGETELRRGRQLTSGDLVVVALPAGQRTYRVE